MSLQQKLSLKLQQKMVLTPTLQQAIKLLQLTRLELQTEVTNELLENPVLEEASTTEETPQQTPEEAAAEETAPLDEFEENWVLFVEKYVK